MFKNYLKIALRQLKRNSGFSLLNMFGLALGLTCAILMLLWIENEVSYNWFHKKYDTLYQVYENQTYEDQTFTFIATPGPLAEAMKKEFPEVKNAARTAWGSRWLFNVDEKPIYEDGNYADPAFLKMFSFDMIWGNPNTALNNDHSLVITQRMAKKFFGEGNPVGRTLLVNNKDEFIITGVVIDPPLNSTIRFDWLAPFNLFLKSNDWALLWGNNGMQTFVELEEGSDVKKFNDKFNGFIHSKEEEAIARPFLLPMKDWRLQNNFVEGKQTGGRIEHVRLFSIIAILLIVIACINFMNLATARSEKRAKEVGVRKVMGAQRKSLMKQFMGEAMITSFIAMFVACVFVLAALPFFNELVERKLSLGFHDPYQWLIFIGVAIFCGLVSGSYPSVYLSSFLPVSIFKGMHIGKTSKAGMVRKSLVVTQFVISTVLIVSTVVIYKQIQHVQNRQLGYNKENLIYISQNGKINENLEAIQNDLLATGLVSHVSPCNQTLIQLGNSSGGFNWEGKDPTTDRLITTEYVGPDYIQTTGMKLVAGRNFNPDVKSDSNNVIINETFAKLIGKKDPVNTILRKDSTKYTVVGVVKDFLYNSMYQKPEPFIVYCQPHSTNFLFIRTKDNSRMEETLAKIGSVLKKHNPAYPFEYNFIDQDFNDLFKSEVLVSKLSRLFAILTIFISCIGLFGLAAYTAERRTKEIGIRKVLGATVSNVVSLLSKDFLVLVTIAIVIATPLAWFIMNRWLENYEYRIEMQWWMFIIAGALALVISLFTVSFQAIKAALSNPTKSLRTE